MKQLKFIVLFAVLTYCFSWLCKWLLILEFAMRPYTATGKKIMTYGQHSVFVGFAFLAAIAVTALWEGSRKT